MQPALKEHLLNLCPSLEKNPQLLEDYLNRFVKSKGNPTPITDISNPHDWRYIEKIKELSEKDFVLVHKTNHLPIGGMIHPSMQPNRLRSTVHCTLNGWVANYRLNDWDSCKYTILIPFDALDAQAKSQIVTFNPIDTFFLGSLKLPKGSIIIGKNSDFEKKRAYLGQAKFEPLPEGADHKEHVFQRILSLGRCPMQANWRTWASWDETRDRAILNEIAKNLGLPRYAMHESSELHQMEDIIKNQNLLDDYAYTFKPTQFLDEYENCLKDDLKASQAEPSVKFKAIYSRPGDDWREGQKRSIHASQVKLDRFISLRPKLERVWTKGLARTRAKDSLNNFAFKLENSHYEKMHGKGESW
jgi:hypothetical protein